MTSHFDVLMQKRLRVDAEQARSSVNILLFYAKMLAFVCRFARVSTCTNAYFENWETKMAYMNQEKKTAIAAELKKVVPEGWKYTLAVRNHSTIVMTIRSAPIDLIQHMQDTKKANGHYGRFENFDERPEYTSVNHYHIDKYFTGDLLETMQAIDKALNLNNFDNSNPYEDYMHVGHYVDLNLGSWDKPFVVTELKQAA